MIGKGSIGFELHGLNLFFSNFLLARYGLGANGLDPDAVLQIFEAKGRLGIQETHSRSVV